MQRKTGADPRSYSEHWDFKKIGPQQDGEHDEWRNTDMMLFKACPKCGGDLYDGKDTLSYFIACIQCGHELNQNELGIWKKGIAALRASAADKAKQAVA